MLRLLKRLFCEDKQSIDVVKTPMKWTVDPMDVINHLVGHIDNTPNIGVRNGIVVHKDGFIRIEIVKNNQKQIFVLTMEQLNVMGYIAPYRILS